MFGLNKLAMQPQLLLESRLWKLQSLIYSVARYTFVCSSTTTLETLAFSGGTMNFGLWPGLAPAPGWQLQPGRASHGGL